MPRRTLLAVALAATFLSANWSAEAQEKPPIKLAHTAPLSGIIAITGRLQSIAIDLSIKAVNESGGINGSKIELLRYDDQLKPEEAVLRIRDAMNAGAVGIIGPVSGTQWETVVPLVNQLRFPAININASKPGINKRPYALRLANNDSFGMPEGMDDFQKHYPNVKKVVIVGDVREASGKSAAQLWTDLAKARGFEVVDTISFTTGVTDFSPTAIKVKQAGADAVLLSAVSPDALRLAREFQIQGVQAPVLANSMVWPGTLPQTLTKTVGKDAALWNTIADSTNESSTGDAKAYAKFVAEYSAEVMKDSTMAQFTPVNVANATEAYDVVALVADILRRKGVDGNTPVAAAREALKDGMVEMKTFTGLNHYEFREPGDAYLRSRVIHVDPNRGMWTFLE